MAASNNHSTHRTRRVSRKRSPHHGLDEFHETLVLSPSRPVSRPHTSQQPQETTPESGTHDTSLAVHSLTILAISIDALLALRILISLSDQTSGSLNTAVSTSTDWIVGPFSAFLHPLTNPSLDLPALAALIAISLLAICLIRILKSDETT